MSISDPWSGPCGQLSRSNVGSIFINLNKVFDHTIDIPVDPEPVPTDLGEPTVKGPFSSEQEHPYFHERPIRDYALNGKSFPNHMELDCAKLLLKTVEVKFNTTYHEIVLCGFKHFRIHAL